MAHITINRPNALTSRLILVCAAVLTNACAANPADAPAQSISEVTSPLPSGTPAPEEIVGTKPGTSPVATPAPTVIPVPIRLTIAYTDGNRLFLWEDSVSRLIAEAEGPISRPKISPDGNLVAYLVAIDPDLGPDFRYTLQVEQLWVAHTDGSGKRLLVDADGIPSGDAHWINSPRSFAWRSRTHSLVFNTRGLQVPPGECCPWDFHDDLWIVDADSGAITERLADGEGGDIYLSPDGRFAALSHPGRITLYDLDSSDSPRNLITFPPILTYSEYAYKPAITWNSDSAFFNVAIPSEDPAAPDSSAMLYRARVDGTIEFSRTVAGNFVFNPTSWDNYPRPYISPDGQHVIFARLDLNGYTSLRWLHISAANDAVGDRRTSLLLPQEWSSDSRRFAYLSLPDGRFRAGEGLVFTLEDGVQSLSTGVIYDARWLNQGNLILHAQIERRKGLYLKELYGETWLLVEGLDETVEFDARLRE